MGGAQSALTISLVAPKGLSLLLRPHTPQKTNRYRAISLQGETQCKEFGLCAVLIILSSIGQSFSQLPLSR